MKNSEVTEEMMETNFTFGFNYKSKRIVNNKFGKIGF
jgi:hypothetical protein